MPYRRARDLKITSIVATPVKVPFRPGHGLPASQELSQGGKPAGLGVKHILRAGTNKGWVGLGETCEHAKVEHLHRNARKLVEVDFDILQVNRLPIPMDREYDGFELMVYDILGHELKVPAYQLLGDACRDRVTCCSPIHASGQGQAFVEQARLQAREAQHHGYDCVMLSHQEPEMLRQSCQAIQDACGRTMRILISPACPWGSLAEAQQAIEAVKGFHVLAIEDALGPEDHQGLGQLRKMSHIPLSSRVRTAGHAAGRPPGAAALDLVRHEACDGLAIDHAMAAFVRVADLAEMAGLACRHGGEADLGILEAGYVHAAMASPACVWPSNIFGRRLREHDLLKTPLVFKGRQVAVPDRPGLGVVLDIHAMEKYRSGDDIILCH